MENNTNKITDKNKMIPRKVFVGLAFAFTLMPMKVMLALGLMNNLGA